MTRLPTARPPEHSDLARREAGEVVVEHEGLRCLLADVHRVDTLLVSHRPEGRHGERLRLPTREQGRAVGSRQQADFAGDVANVVHAPAIDPLPVIEDATAHDLLLQLPQGRADILPAAWVLFLEAPGDVAAQRGECMSAFVLVRDLQRVAHPAGGVHGDLRDDLRIGSDGLVLERLGRPGPRHQLALETDELDDRFLSDAHRLQEPPLPWPRGRRLPPSRSNLRSPRPQSRSHTSPGRRTSG